MAAKTRSTPLSLTLIRIWCWLNVVAMLPTLRDPVIVLFGFGDSGPMASLLKILIFVNGIAISIAVTARVHPGRVILIGWLPFVFLSSLLIDLIPSCPYPVKVAAYEQVLFGQLIPYLYVTLIPLSNFLPMHIVNALVSVSIIGYLIKCRSLFTARRPVTGFRRRAAGH